jgi:hypothetical protein
MPTRLAGGGCGPKTGQVAAGRGKPRARTDPNPPGLRHVPPMSENRAVGMAIRGQRQSKPIALKRLLINEIDQEKRQSKPIAYISLLFNGLRSVLGLISGKNKWIRGLLRPQLIQVGKAEEPPPGEGAFSTKAAKSFNFIVMTPCAHHPIADFWTVPFVVLLWPFCRPSRASGRI